MSLMSLRFISVLVLILPRTSAGQFSCIRREEHEFVTLYGIEGYEGSTTHPNTRQVTTCLHWARGLVKQVILPSRVRSALKSIWSYAPGLRWVCAGSALGLRGLEPGLRRVCAGSAPGLRRVCAGSTGTYHGDSDLQLECINVYDNETTGGRYIPA